MISLIPFLFLVHSWYPFECCHDDDCHKAEVISSDKNGITLKVNKDTIVVSNLFSRRPSQDDSYHICYRRFINFQGEESTTIFCFFVPGDV
jgi:hypothetical protein